MNGRHSEKFRDLVYVVYSCKCKASNINARRGSGRPLHECLSQSVAFIVMNIYKLNCVVVVQSVERQSSKLDVAGSSRVYHSSRCPNFWIYRALVCKSRCLLYMGCKCALAIYKVSVTPTLKFNGG